MSTGIHGSCEPRFERVRAVLAGQMDDGLDVGASVAVALDGELVVDIWGGHQDAERTRPWERNTIVNVFSTTKPMTALCALILADHGELDPHAPVARYWPEFAAAGEERIEVRQLLGHTAGLPGWDERLQSEDLADWERCTTLLAAQAPRWEPGTASGYHAVTQGYLVGEVVRRITGLSLGRFFCAGGRRATRQDHHRLHDEPGGGRAAGRHPRRGRGDGGDRRTRRQVTRTEAPAAGANRRPT